MTFRRAIARWATRQSPTNSTTATAAAAQPIPASALALSRRADSARDGAANGRSDGVGSPATSTDDEDAVERHDPRHDWILKVFRGRAATTAAANSRSSSSAGDGGRLAPLVVVNALRATLPAVVAASPPAVAPSSGDVFPPPATASGGGERGAPLHGGSRTSSAAAAPAPVEVEAGGAWLNPLSWLRNRAVPRPGGGLPAALPPPPRPSLPPRVAVRVVYAAAVPEMLDRLALVAERREKDKLVRERVASNGGSDAAGDGSGMVGGSGGGGGRGEPRKRR